MSHTLVLQSVPSTGFAACRTRHNPLCPASTSSTGLSSSALASLNAKSRLSLPLSSQRCLHASVVIPRAFNNNNNNSGNQDYGDRVLASVAYLLPLLDAFPFAKFILLQYPFVARAFAPLGPLMALYHAFPFAPFIIFLVIYNGVVNNPNYSRFVRYNAAQAVVLDVLLIIPQVILNDVFRAPIGDELGLQAYITTFNTIFLFVAVCTAYGMGSCLVGQTPRLPLVADAADSQVRPF